MDPYGFQPGLLRMEGVVIVDAEYHSDALREVLVDQQPQAGSFVGT